MIHLYATSISNELGSTLRTTHSNTSPNLFQEGTKAYDRKVIHKIWYLHDSCQKKKSPLGLSDYLDNLIGGFWDSQLVLVGKNIPASVGDIRDMGSVPGLGRSPRGGQGNPPQNSCLENPMDRGAWWATVRNVAKSQT